MIRIMPVSGKKPVVGPIETTVCRQPQEGRYHIAIVY